MRKPYVVPLIVLLQATITSCGTAPVISPAADGNANRIDSQSRIGLAVGRFAPALSVDGDARPGQYALRGALSGGAQCGVFSTLGGLPGLVLGLACLPFGLTIGAVAGAQRAAPSRDVDTAKSEIQSVAKELDLAPLLAAELERYARSRDIAGMALLPDQGPRTPDEEPRYSGPVDIVFEFSITEIKATTPASAELPYRFIVSAKGRLIRVRDHAVLEQLSTSMTTGAASVGYWTADAGAALLTELRGLMQKLAQSSLEELLVIYRGDANLAVARQTVFPQSGSGARWGEDERHGDSAAVVPPYVLRPIEPPVGVSMRFAKRPMLPLHLDPAPVASLRPTLTWEKLPRSVAPQIFEGAPARASELTYEVEIYNGGMRSLVGPVPVMAAARVVQRHTGLREPRVQTEELQPCHHYFWTVRAHLNLDGRPRSTEWSGAYLAFGANADPRSIRLPTGGWGDTRFPLSAFFFPFQTPAADGKPCTTVW